MIRAKLLLVGPWLGLLIHGSLCRAQDLAELELDHQARSTFVTPHTAWGRPSVTGPARVLFFLDGRGTAPREVIELRQRFDLDPEMVFWTRVIDSSQEQWHGGDRGIQRMANLLSQRWDAFVFLDIPMERMPVEQQYQLVKAVTKGAGLVLAGGDDPRVLKGKNRIEPLPDFLSDVNGAVAFRVLQGRGLRLAKTPSIPFRPGWEVAYDEWCMRLGKAILWAAGKEPPMSLSFSSAFQEFSRENLPAKLEWAWKGAQPGYQASVSLRREDGQVILSEQESLSQPGGGLPVEIPRLRAGNYHLDVVVRDGPRVAGFGSTLLRIECPGRAIDLTVEPDWAEPGKELSGRVRVTGEPARGRGQRIVVSLFDSRDREIARQVFREGVSEVGYCFPVQPWFPMLLEVRATLRERGEEVTSAWKFARVVKRHRGQFNFVMWDTPGGNLAPWAERALAQTGVSVHLRAGNPEPVIAAEDMAWIPYTTRLGKPCQPVCWADEAGIQAHVEEIVNKHRDARKHGVFAYSLGDEIAVRGSCMQHCCQQAYRDYLQESYGDVAALNASWGTRFASFSDAQPSDNDESVALKAGNFPRWFDRQCFQSANFARLCTRFGEAFRRLDPQSRCGFEGAGTFHHADDLDAFVRSNTFWVPYPGTADEVLRSIAPRDFPRANWMGYTKDADSLLEKYWRMITLGCDSVWWWRWDALGRFHGWLAPTLDPYPAVQELLRDTQVVRNGLGDLLLASEMQTDGIGLLYSLPSAYAARVENSSTFGTYEGCHTAFHQALRELGLNFRYFTDRQVQRGEVKLDAFKVIVLPFTQAMGAAEADLLRRYVREGGLLLADVRPAIYDGHVKPLAAGLLDDVFGIERLGRDAAVTRDAQVFLPAGEQLAFGLPKARVDPGVRVAGAGAWGEAGESPLFLVHPFGRGRAVLLNLAMSSFPSLGVPEAEEVAARALQAILDLGAVAPALLVTDEEGRRLRNAEISRWRNGEVQIFSVFRHQGRPETAVLHLPEAMPVYELKAGRDCGRMSTVSIPVTPGRASFFAICPPLTMPGGGPIALSGASRAGHGEVLKVRVTSRLPDGLRAVRLRLLTPCGAPAEWGDAVVLASTGGVEVNVPVAFNDPCGVWTLQATELFTNQSTQLRFAVPLFAISE